MPWLDPERRCDYHATQATLLVSSVPHILRNADRTQRIYIYISVVYFGLLRTPTTSSLGFDAGIRQARVVVLMATPFRTTREWKRRGLWTLERRLSFFGGMGSYHTPFRASLVLVNTRPCMGTPLVSACAAKPYPQSPQDCPWLHELVWSRLVLAHSQHRSIHGYFGLGLRFPSRHKTAHGYFFGLGLRFPVVPTADTRPYMGTSSVSA